VSYIVRWGILLRTIKSFLFCFEVVVFVVVVVVVFKNLRQKLDNVN
jgi:hypothetical protein